MTTRSYTVPMKTKFGPMTRPRLLTTIALAALAYAAIAVADPGPATTNLVSATFYANTLTSSHSQSCTSAGGDAYTTTHATFTGTASSNDARLAGPITVDVTSVWDSTKSIGWLSGDLRISPTAPPTPAPGHLHAHLLAVNVNGNVQGSVTGDLGAGARLLGSFSGTFSPTGGFGSSNTPASIGTGTGTNTAIVTSGNCAPPHQDDHPGTPHQDDQHGPKH
jgi:hypothetical protein